MSIIYPKRYEPQPPIEIVLDISTIHELIYRLKTFHPDACDDDYIGTFIKRLEDEVEEYYNQPTC